jgi:hypothetical protein
MGGQMDVGLSIGFIVGGCIVMLVGLLLLLAGKSAMDSKGTDFISVIIGIALYWAGWVVVALAGVLGLLGLVV